MSNVIEIVDSDDENQILEGNSLFINADDDLSLKPETVDESRNLLRNRRRRKSGHQSIKESDDISFVTIALDDDEETHDAHPSLTNNPGNSINEPIQYSTYAILDRAFDEFITNSEIDSKLKKIAEERVRVNCLLSCFGMPEIIFDLYNQNENLMAQLDNCLEQYKISGWEMRRLQELKDLKQRQSFNLN